MILEELRAELEKLQAEGRLRELSASQQRSHAEIEYRGRTLVDFTRWDYLALNQLLPFKRSLQTLVETHGIGSCSSRLNGGTNPTHCSAEKRLAQFFGFESALLFSSRNQALLSLVTTIADEQDLILTEELSSSAIADAAYLVNATLETFRDPAALENLLQTKTLHVQKAFRRRFLVLETLSPLNGDPINLAPYYALARKYAVTVILDESHALAALGARGAGGSETITQLSQQPLAHSVLCCIADLSLGVGCFGAALVAPSILISSVIQRSRMLRTEPSLPAGLAAAIETGLNTIELAFLEREKLITLAKRLKRGISKRFLLSQIDADSPIVCLQFGKMRDALATAQALLHKGILAEVLNYGLSLNDSGILRFIVTKEHSERQIDNLLEALNEILIRIQPTSN